MSILDVVRSTLDLMETIAVRGRADTLNMAAAMGNLAAIIEALEKPGKEASHDRHDGPGEDLPG